MRPSNGVGSSTGTDGEIASSVACCIFAFLFAFFCVRCLPIRGGGEEALETDFEADGREPRSANSLSGVPGWLVDVRLGRLDETFEPPVMAEPGGILGSGGIADSGRGGGASVFGVSVIRRVRGWVVRRTGVFILSPPGVAGRELAD
jgi:hypothetical protein